VKHPPIRETNFAGLGRRHQGKVRDIYDLGKYLLLVATDRISAFDVVMNEPVPGKGTVLNQLSVHWLKITDHIVPNHLISYFLSDYPRRCQEYGNFLTGRSMLVKKCEVLPVECIVRGYLSGSGWAEYKKTGEIKGIKLPSGLVESDRLPEPIFTPSTKADLGQHDENISFADMADKIGKNLAKRVREISLQLYIFARDYASSRGIIIADTKFEFGLDENGELILIDEVLTPDSSRFWPDATYKPGGSQKSYDKQYLRDYLESLIWNKQPPPPPLPSEVIMKTREKYFQALKVLTGQDLS
jgi:phosphoribosylaminoimidazole-succinocarboxamide synthase